MFCIRQILKHYIVILHQKKVIVTQQILTLLPLKAGHLTEPTEPATGSTEIDETVTAQETAEPAVESDEFDGPAQETEMSSESAADTKEAGTDGLTMEMEKERTDDDAEKAQPTEGTSEAEPASLQRESSKQPDAFSSSISMKHLVYILLLFMLLCGGVVL